MFKKNQFYVVILVSIMSFLFSTVFSQKYITGTSHSSELISKYQHFPLLQLNDTADYYFKSGSYDTAIVCYSLLISNTEKKK